MEIRLLFMHCSISLTMLLVNNIYCFYETKLFLMGLVQTPALVSRDLLPNSGVPYSLIFKKGNLLEY